MPTKLIQAYRNASYGPPLVTSKYSPLENIDFAEADKLLCNTLLTRRRRVLRSVGLLPQLLYLILPNWESAIENERDKNPPLVVISSNRSNWIKKGLEAGALQLRKLKIPQFDNASDLRALTALAKQKFSPPMYSPARIGDATPRNVYVVVHAAEYEIYKTNLADSGITVVGWSFRRPRRDALTFSGFGASRFAAIELCKQLRTAAGEPWDYAWLFDDNVVAFTSFAGYEKVEQVMDAAAAAAVADKTGKKKPYIAAGFTGGTATIAAEKNKEWAEREIEAGETEESERGKQYEELPESADTGLIQQAALWNIAELTKRNLNFGPIFVTSGEDVSLGNYFDAKEIPYLYYEGIKIRKEDTENDGGPGAQAVQKGREELAELIAESERIDARPYLRFPPPIMFKALKKKGDRVPHDAGEQTLGRFIVKTVLPNASAATQLVAGEKKTQNTAMCQATEQTICKAIKLGKIDDEALDLTFKINGAKPQQVRRVSKR